MNWLMKLMQGRYGVDQLGITMLAVYFVAMIIVNIFRLPYVSLILLLLLVWMFYRMLSRNIEKRRKENDWFLRKVAPITAWFQNRSVRAQGRMARKQQRQAARDEKKNYVHFACGQCGQVLRVPRGKGKVHIRCPKCKNEFDGKA